MDVECPGCEGDGSTIGDDGEDEPCGLCDGMGVIDDADLPETE